MADRFNLGKPARGEAFHPGFVSPWNAGTLDHDGAEIGLMPTSSIPETFAGEMDGDAQTTFTGGGKAKRARK
jgi:hypothetical protein